MQAGVVCVCSRGLIHSRTMRSIESNLMEARDRGEEWHIEYTDDLPIPDAQNTITLEALSYGPEWIWFVEEDNVIPDGLLFDMLVLAGHASDVVVADYPLKNGVRSLFCANDGRVLFGGMGCLLVRASVFGRIAAPWFDTGECYFDPQTGEVEARPGKAIYGGQDISFFRRLKNAGIQPIRAPRDCGHLRLRHDQAPRTNNGVIDVVEL